MKKLMIPDLRYFVFLAYNMVNLKVKWLEQTFLKYLDDWETYVKTKDAIPKAAKQFLLTSIANIIRAEANWKVQHFYIVSLKYLSVCISVFIL